MLACSRVLQRPPIHSGVWITMEAHVKCLRQSRKTPPQTLRHVFHSDLTFAAVWPHDVSTNSPSRPSDFHKFGIRAPVSTGSSIRRSSRLKHHPRTEIISSKPKPSPRQPHTTTSHRHCTLRHRPTTQHRRQTASTALFEPHSITMSNKPSPSQPQSQAAKKQTDEAPKGPETDPNVVGRPASIIGIYLVFAVVVLIAAWLGGAQSSTLVVRMKEVWAKVVGR